MNANVIYLQNPTVSVYTTNFLVGSSKQANLLIRDQTISAILCSIRLDQVLLYLTSHFCDFYIVGVGTSHAYSRVEVSIFFYAFQL